MTVYDGLLALSGSTAPPPDAVLLRNSSVDSFLLCPSRVGYSSLDGFDDTPSEAMSFGTMGHSAFELDILEGLHSWTRSDMELLWKQAVARDGHDLYSLASSELIEASTTEAVAMVSKWQREVYPRIPKDAIPEPRMETQLGVLPNGREVWVHGTPDLIVPSLAEVWDWKTAGSAWRAGKAESSGQPAMYPWLAQRTRGLEVGAAFRFFVYDRAKAEWGEITTTRSEAEVDAYIKTLWQIAKAIDAQAFTHTPWAKSGQTKRGWWCSAKFCGAWNVCHGKYIADNVWEDQVREPSMGWEGK